MMMNTNILKAQTNLKTCGPIDFVLQLQLEILIDRVKISSCWFL